MAVYTREVHKFLLEKLDKARKDHAEASKDAVNARKDSRELLDPAYTYANDATNTAWDKVLEYSGYVAGAIVVDTPDSFDVVGHGNHVAVLVHYPDGEEKELIYFMGGEKSHGILKTREGHIMTSTDAPIGAALIGSKVDETVFAETPIGVFRLKVLRIW